MDSAELSRRLKDSLLANPWLSRFSARGGTREVKPPEMMYRLAGDVIFPASAGKVLV